MSISQTGHCAKCYAPFKNARSKNHHYKSNPDHGPKRLKTNDIEEISVDLNAQYEQNQSNFNPVYMQDSECK